MSEAAGRPPKEAVNSPQKSPAPKPKSVVLRVFGWSVLSVVVVILLLLAGVTWYTGTDDFQRRVGGEVVSTLENATGGRVELQHLSFHLWHLAIEADGLVIHGTEEPGQMPYLSASKIFLRLHFNMILTHIRGLGPQSRISLRYLRVEQPRVHLIVYKDGHTNQPTPKHRITSNQSMEDTLLDLQARKVELVDGLAVLNDRAIPFDLAANDVNAEVHYVRRSDEYGATIDLADLQTKIAKRPEVQSRMHLTAELGRDRMAVTKLEFWSGAEASGTGSAGTGSAHLVAQASMKDFAHPRWEGSAAGSVGLKQLGDLANVDGLVGGTIDVNLQGHNCVAQPAAVQPQGRFWQRRGKQIAPAVGAASSDANCTQGYVIAGSTKMHKVGYRDVNVRVMDVDGSAQVHITPAELKVTDIVAILPRGGGAKGDLRIEDWLGSAPAAEEATSATAMAAATTANSTAQSIGARKPVKPLVSVQPGPKGSHAYLTATVDHIPLRTVMDIVAVPNYGDLGFDTSITGPATVEWGDPSSPTVADTVQVESHLTFAPVGMQRRGVKSNVPVTGDVVGHYDGRLEVVNIAHLALQSTASSLVTSGVLGVNLGDPLTNLQVNLQTRDLGEFDQLLNTLAFEANGRKGAAAIPLVLHGNANFVGTTKGAIRDLDVKGHVTANDLVVQASEMGRGIPDVHIDSVVGSADYSPNGGVSVVSSTITRGTAVLNLVGTFRPRREMVQGAPTYVWDKELAVDASAKLADAQATDLLQIAGVAQKVPVTGTVNLDLSGSGTVHNIIGGGMVTLTNGVAYGENYQKVAVNVAAEGQQVSLTKVLVEVHGLSITGSAGYNLATKQMRGQVSGNHLQLSKFDTFRKAEPDADGVLTFTAIANGTLQQPDLHARVTLDKISVQGKQLGGLEAKADSAGSNLAYALQSKMVGAQLSASGQTSLLGDYPTQAKLTVSGLDIANVIALMAPGSFKGTSAIAGTVSVSGPAAKPKMLQGSAEFSDVDLKLQGIELKAAQPMRASLKNGTVTLDQIHVTGQDTDLRAAGTAVVFGDTNPQGGRIDLTANGSISMALASSIDPKLISSGKVTFKVAAEGRMKKPTLTGDVAVQNVNLAIEGVANGLSNLNGTLVFNEDRLDVQNMTAMTGGGQLKIGGYLAYQKGFFADLTATGDVVRVRYNGLSATANASLRLQGQPQGLLLSGNVLVTRFGVGADVDFAALSSAGGVQAPPDPNSLMNKIRLDVHIVSSPQLDFQNSFAKLAGSVNLTVGGTLAVPSVLGRIQITDGSATYLGTKYELERGSIYFSNPVRIDPTIDLDATTRVENYDITIGVHGTITNLKPTYRSEPPLTEADIFNLLALGRTQEEAQLYQQQEEQIGADPTTNALLGGALNATVASRVGKLFGAGSVKIDPAFIGTLGNSSARITVTEPLSKQVTLVFATNVNETAQQLIQVQYQLNEEYSIVATRDENDVFSVVFKIRKRYK
jgi:translocation and assembly module TamB